MVVMLALAHRNYASVRHFAHHVLKLDCRVIDTKLRVQALFHIPQDTLAYRRWNVRN